MTFRVPVEEAAKEIGCHKDFVKQQMRRGLWDLGAVVTPRMGQRKTYLIFRPKLDKFLGKSERGEEVEKESS